MDTLAVILYVAGVMGAFALMGTMMERTDANGYQVALVFIIALGVVVWLLKKFEDWTGR